jgi:exodeoxyribonuclease V gamma subunit
VRDVQEGTSPVVLPIEERLDAFTITGVLDTLFPAGQLCYRYANTRGVDLIDAWLRHLLWCRRSDDAAACVTMIFNKDGRRRFAPVDDAQVYLKQLLTLYRQAGHEPLPLFPKASWQYAVLRYENGRSREEALDRVRSRWRQTYAMPSEAEDPYIQYCFGGEEALGERFAALTEDLFGPIMEYSESI